MNITGELYLTALYARVGRPRHLMMFCCTRSIAADSYMPRKWSRLKADAHFRLSAVGLLYKSDCNVGRIHREQRLINELNQLECGQMSNVMAAQPNIGATVCEGSIIPFLVSRRKVWLTPAA